MSINKNLVPIYPDLAFVSTCPLCTKLNTTAIDVNFFGLHVVGEFVCENCNSNYFHTLPQGHGAQFPISYTADFSKISYPQNAKFWFAIPFLESLSNVYKQKSPFIKRSISSKHKKIVIINCLDSCYGHVFYKFLSIQFYQNKYPDHGIIAIVPKSMLWLCPVNLAEKWIVDLPISELNYKILTIDKFIKSTFSDFEEVSIASRYANPDFEKVDFEKMLSKKRFSLDDFDAKPLTISFILREDRFWYSSKTERWFRPLSSKYRVARLFKSWLIFRQNNKYKQLAKKLKISFPEITIYATGIGIAGDLGNQIIDMRELLHATDPMERWKKIYAQSHIVVCVHGSELLIPTALSAGFVEILTEHKIQNITEEIAMLHHSKYMRFLGRYVEECASVDYVYKHINYMLNNFKLIKINH